MPELRNAVLATLAYYGQLGLPLTLQEVYAYLINPARVDRVAQGVGDVTLAAVAAVLEALARGPRVLAANGFYFLPDLGPDAWQERVRREKESAEKFRKLIGRAWWFQAVPYVRALLVSGSLAVSSAEPTSDFDVLVVAAGGLPAGRQGRLYTCRALLSLAASLLGARRTRHDAMAPDKFCFNHYIVDGSLAIPHESIVTAQIYAALVPIYAQGDVVSALYAANPWLNRYLYNFRPVKEDVRRSVAPSRPLQAVARFGERVLDTFVGGWLERILKRWQQRRIRSNPVTYAPGGRTVFNDTELEFHPHSFELGLVAAYNSQLQKLGIVPVVTEQDSGLQ